MFPVPVAVIIIDPAYVVLLPGNGKLAWLIQFGQGKNGVGVGVGDKPGVFVLVGLLLCLLF